MKYIVGKDYIKIFRSADFDLAQTMECGQVFSYKKLENGDYLIYPGEQIAVAKVTDDSCVIQTDNPNYFENYFDLKTDYSKIKSDLSTHPVMSAPLKNGSGIRILRQEKYEMLVSFILSSQNLIPRIKASLNKIREKFGQKISTPNGDVYTFPTYDVLQKITKEDFWAAGAGFRAEYLVGAIKKMDPKALAELEFDKNGVPRASDDMQKDLRKIDGVGPKVADCVLLFGFGRGDVFPVDAWIKKMYEKFYPPIVSVDGSKLSDQKIRDIMRKNLINEFGQNAGYAQQYLFDYIRQIDGAK